MLHHAIENKSVFYMHGTTLVWDVLRNEVAGWTMRPLDGAGVGSVRLFSSFFSLHVLVNSLTDAPLVALREPRLHILHPPRRHPRR